SRQRCGGGTGCGEGTGLVNAPQFLRESLRPSARKRGVVIDENERAVIDRLAFEDRLDQGKRLAILVPGRIGQFIVGAGELPVKKPEEGTSPGFLIQRKPGRK